MAGWTPPAIEIEIDARLNSACPGACILFSCVHSREIASEGCPFSGLPQAAYSEDPHFASISTERCRWYIGQVCDPILSFKISAHSVCGRRTDSIARMAVAQGKGRLLLGTDTASRELQPARKIYYSRGTFARGKIMYACEGCELLFFCVGSSKQAGC